MESISVGICIALIILYPSPEDFLRLCRLRKERRGRCHRERVSTNLSGKVAMANWEWDTESEKFGFTYASEKRGHETEFLNHIRHIHVEQISTHVGKSVYLFELGSSATPG